MSRTEGAQNVPSFQSVGAISTTNSSEIKHLATVGDETEVDRYHALIKHQHNYLRWIHDRHWQLDAARKELNILKNERKNGPKPYTYTKYTWYAEHNALLEAINGFEVFYKRTLIALAKAIHDYVNSDKIKGSVDAKILWNANQISVEELLFEHQLFHDLDNIDKCTDTLIGKKRYNKNDVKTSRANENRALQAVFQIRHTLSHNHGEVTSSDLSKLRVLGYDANAGEIIDPSKNHLGRSIARLLSHEATSFTQWLLAETADYLKRQSESRGLILSSEVLASIKSNIGSNQNLDDLEWA